MGTPAIDPTYERQADTPTETVIYWWPDRCYRKVKMSRLLWGRCDAVDPDAAMQPDRTLFPPAPNAFAVQRLLDELEANGPGTSRELCERLGLSYSSSHGSSIAYSIRQSAGLVRVVGWRQRPHPQRPVAVYGLAEHQGLLDVAPPPVLPPALLWLKEHPGWHTARTISQSSATHKDTLAAQLKKYRQHVAMCLLPCQVHNRVLDVRHYAWRERRSQP